MKDHIQHNIEITERVVSNQKDTSIDKMKRLRYNNIVDVITPNTNRNLPLLDIGARKGELLDIFKEYGFENLYAIEIWPEGIEIMKEKNYVIVDGDAQNFCLIDMFGTIVVSHVLEHCPNPHKVIRNIDNSLLLNGFVYIEVPAQKKGAAPESTGHYSFFPNVDAITGLFDMDRWLLVGSGGVRNNIFILMRKMKDGK